MQVSVHLDKIENTQIRNFVNGENGCTITFATLQIRGGETALELFTSIEDIKKLVGDLIKELEGLDGNV